MCLISFGVPPPLTIKFSAHPRSANKRSVRGKCICTPGAFRFRFGFRFFISSQSQWKYWLNSTAAQP